ncbi:MAG: 3'(2'),5'-bisphosphate nucleotidase CysQ [Alphaproteobacteria bacterium]|nr:3'(2'),5'-bisphosphate nucleotidase CysQ [Alphaproteobacteria bacterium]
MKSELRQNTFWHPLLSLAQEAGKIIMEIYKAPTQEIRRKDDSSPLTRADLAAHTLIWEGLTRHTPDIPIVCEEKTVNLSSLDADKPFWLVDPLDGTKEFLQRNGMFTVNIALIEMGSPVFGVIYAPAFNALYWGAKTWGAWQGGLNNPSPLAVSSLATPPRLLVSKNHLNQETSDFLNRFAVHDTLQMGSSLKFCAIAEGKADIYPRFAPTSQWDTAAGQAILEGAGGYVYTEDGQRLSYGQLHPLNPSFIAASVPYEAL